MDEVFFKGQLSHLSKHNFFGHVTGNSPLLHKPKDYITKHKCALYCEGRKKEKRNQWHMSTDDKIDVKKALKDPEKGPSPLLKGHLLLN